MMKQKKRLLFNRKNRRSYFFVIFLFSFFMLFLISIESYALQIDSVSSGTYGKVSSKTLSHTTGSETDRLLLVTLAFNNENSQTVKSVKYNSVALTKVGSVASGNDVRIEFWSLKSPPSGQHNVDVTFSSSITHGGVVSTISFSGVDQSNSYSAFVSSSNQRGSSPPSKSIGSATNELVFAVAGCEDCSSLKSGSGQKEYWNLKTTANEYTISSGVSKVGASSVTLSWTQGSKNHWAIGAISVKPSSIQADTTAPSVPTNLAASGITSSQVTLTWTASSDLQSGISFYEIYRGGSKVGQINGTTYTDTGLSAVTSYLYEVLAVNGASLKSGKASVTATTSPPPDTTAPSVPTNLVANVVSVSQIDLTWSSSVDSESDVSYYNVYRNNVKVAQPTSTSYSDKNLNSGTTYTYQISATNSIGLESTKSISESATTKTQVTVDTTAPSVPSNLLAKEAVPSGVDLTWNQASDSESGVAYYSVYRNGLKIAQTINNVYLDLYVKIGITYNYEISATNNAGLESGKSSLGTIVLRDTVAPTIPLNFVATKIGSTEIDLSWTSSTDNVGVIRYKILRNGVLIGTTYSTTYQDRGLTPLTSYKYTLISYDTAGNEASPVNYVVSTISLSANPPIRYSGLPVGKLPYGTKSVTLSLVTNENANCKYSNTIGNNYDSMSFTFTTTGGTSHSAIVSGLTDSVAYNYYVRCKDISGNVNLDDYKISFSIEGPKAGDLNLDGQVNILDVNLIITDFGKKSDFNPKHDINNDGVIDLLDLMLEAKNWVS